MVEIWIQTNKFFGHIVQPTNDELKTGDIIAAWDLYNFNPIEIGFKFISPAGRLFQYNDKFVIFSKSLGRLEFIENDIEIIN